MLKVLIFYVLIMKLNLDITKTLVFLVFSFDFLMRLNIDCIHFLLMKIKFLFYKEYLEIFIFIFKCILNRIRV
jgi:hypothetical protein